jgi:parvulin-like peptidyl-prolyl isomerase
MMVRRLRRLAVPLVVGAVALGLTGCDNSTSDAATVTLHDSSGDHVVHISRSELTSEIGQLLANKSFVDELQKSGVFPDVKGTGTTDQQLAGRWLTTLVRQSAVDAEFSSVHAAITAEDTNNAISDQQSNFSQAVFAAFPKAFANKLVDRDARLFAVFRYYQTCPSGRFVSHILLKTEAEANAARQLIQGGETFANVARTKSIDTTSGKAGGALGCLTPDEFVPPFENAANAAAFGVVTGPVKSQFGYHLILVRRWDPVGDKSYAQALSQAASAILSARLKALKVRVDPRYGTWSEQTDSSGNAGFAVVPPSVPNPGLCREKNAVCRPTSTTTSTTTVPAGG